MSVAPRGTHTLSPAPEPNEMDKDVTHPRMLYALRSRKEKPHRILSPHPPPKQRESDKWKIRVPRRLLLCAEKLICSSRNTGSERERVPAVMLRVSEAKREIHFLGGWNKSFALGLINKSACTWLPSRVGFVSLLGVLFVLKWDALIQAAQFYVAEKNIRSYR
jgi:hypothetical protein